MPSKWKNVPARPDSPEIVTLLMVSPVDEDVIFLRRTFQHPEWRIEWVKDCESAREMLKSSVPRVVVCEGDLPDGSWRNILDALQELPAPPNLVVTSRLADEYLWAEVLNLGGYDVLVKPFDAGEVLRVIGMASRKSAHRHEKRKSAGSITAGSSTYFYGS